MERMGWEQKWARTGVKAVIEPQAAADNRRTFSPPTLQTQDSLYEPSLIFLLAILIAPDYYIWDNNPEINKSLHAHTQPVIC